MPILLHFSKAQLSLNFILLFFSILPWILSKLTMSKTENINKFAVSLQIYVRGLEGVGQ